MTPERWLKVKELFTAALELQPGERGSFLDGACAGQPELRTEIEAMLRSDGQNATFFEEPVISAPLADPMAGREIGLYRIVRRIGRGGMGSVYLAERADDQFRRRVALKVVRPEQVDEQALRRFHNERQTLAVLDHPNIIKLLDGGTTGDGLPFLVMDYVEGQAIDDYCEAHNLPVRERLELFRTVCAAVHYAHQNLVVHRDLKPGNILVTPDGVPKLLDFGIAKLLRPEYSAHPGGFTRTYAQPMTPEYASPEQIQGRPVTTASDIYALGVLLYRLLTGQHPFELKTKSVLELQRAVCEQEPERPSTVASRTGHAPAAGRADPLVRTLRGDLDTIVLMAMRKEPQRRYASAEHLAEDIRRHLVGLPVLARKNTLAYRTSKFITRHTATVAMGAIAAVVLAASGWTALTEYQRATRRFEDLRQFANFAINDLNTALNAGATPAREQLVAKATQYLDSLAREAGHDRTLLRELLTGYVKMGDVQGNLYAGNLGELRKAAGSYNKAFRIAEQLARDDTRDTAAKRDLASIQMKLGDLAAPTGDRAEATERYAQALSIYEQLLAAEPGDTQLRLALMNLWSKLGYVQGELGDPASALESFRHCLELGQALDPNSNAGRNAVAFAKERIAYFSVLNGEPADATQAVRDALEIYKRSAGSKPSKPALRNIARAYKTMAEVEKRLGKVREALENCRESLRIREELLAEDARNIQFQIDLHQTLVLLIDLLSDSGDKAEQHQQTARALRFLQPLVSQPESSQYHLQNYAWILLTTPFSDLQDHEAAMAAARRAVELTHRSDPEALDLLSRAFEKVNQRIDAVTAEKQALALLPPVKSGKPEMRQMLETRLARLGSAAASPRESIADKRKAN